MNNKWLYIIIAVLLVTNIFSVLTSFNKEKATEDKEVILAKVGDVTITKEMWDEQLSERHGQDVLKDMINRFVVFQLAKEQGISISQEAIDQEVSLYQAMYETNYHQDEHDLVKSSTEIEKLKQDIEYILLLEELYTRDIVIREEELKKFYTNNLPLFVTEQTYNLSHIVVDSLAEINEIVEELKGGSSFEGLAMERSTDINTAKRGGEIGYVSQQVNSVPEEYFSVADQLKLNEFSDPIALENGFAIILLKDKIASKTYAFEDMKGQIRRQLAMLEIEGEVSAEQFWDEIGVEWYYNEY